MQNVEAVNLLIKDIWPIIKRKTKSVKLWISGRNVPREIMDFAKKDLDIEVTESIEDNRDAYKSAAVLVAPINGPGGTRLKVLEAMASGLPVVSTPVGVAGLGITPGKEALVATSINDLSDLTVKLLKNKEFAGRIGESGKSFVAKNFDWRSIVDRLNTIYEETRTVGNNS